MLFEKESENDELNRANPYKIITPIVFLIVVGIFVVYILGQFVYGHTQVSGTYTFMNSDWTWHKNDGTTEKVSLPCHLNTERGEDVILTSTIPVDVEDGMYMYIMAGRNLKIIIDGECRYELKQSDMELPGKIVKSVYIPIELYKSDAGKSIKFVKQEAGARNGNFNEIMYGNLSAMNYRIMALYMPTFSMAVILLLVSIGIIVAGWVIKFRRHTDFPIRTMSYGIMLLSIWAICDSQAYQFVFRNYYVDGIVGYMIACIAPLPFIHYLDKIQERRYEKLYVTISIMQIVVALMAYAAHFSNIMSFEITRPYINTMTGISCVAVMVTIVRDKLMNNIEDYKNVVMGIIALAVCGCVEMLYINLYHEQTYGLFIIIGLYILVAAAFTHSLEGLNKIEKERQEALNASLMKSTFLANMSHEIRTPINSIMGMNEMILRENDDPEIREYAENIGRSSRLLLGIISDILDFSKIEAGKTEVYTETYDVAMMLRDLTAMLEELTIQKNLRAVVTVSDTIPATLTGDRLHIQQIIINLLSNAVKYTEDGSVTFSLHAKKNEEGKCVLCFRISDTGIGMSKESVSHIFDSFSRFDEKKNRNVQGTGLGMAITKNLVDLIEGQINIESEYGRGTSVVVEVPQIIASEETIGTNWRSIPKKEKARGYKEKFKAPEARILAVDDNNTNLLIIRQYLKKTDIGIDLCNNGKEALEKCSNGCYDIILLDHMMPVMDGIETIENLRNDTENPNSKTVIIALTANAIAGSRDFYLEKGFDDYITKPIEADSFEEIIMKYLPKEKVIVI